MTPLDERLRVIDERAGKASAGPWKTWGMSVMSDQNGTSNVDTAIRVAATGYSDGKGRPRTNDADFIAASRTDVPALVKALQECRKQRNRFRAAADLKPE